MTSPPDFGQFGQLRPHVKEFIPASRSTSAPPLASPARPTRTQTPASLPPPTSRVFIPGVGLAHEQDPPPPDPVSPPRPHPLSSQSSFELPRLLSRAMEALPRRHTARSLFLPDDLRQYFAAQARCLYTSQPSNDPMINELHRKFHSFLCLDDPSARALSGSLGYPSVVFKAVSSKDGHVYAVRRVDNIRSSPTLGTVQTLWSRVSNANAVPLREVITQNRALFLVHDFVPGAQTLAQFVEARQGQLLPEAAIWSVAMQLLSGVRAVHAAGLGGVVLGPTKVLLTGRHRARLGGAGLSMALEPAAHVLELQQDDILWIGKLIVVLATMNLQSLTNLGQAVELMKQVYTPELVAFALHPFKVLGQKQQCNVYDLLALASQGLLAENDALYAHGDALEEALSRTYEADRHFRLMTKLSVVCERPPLPGQKPSDSWSETDDRYIVKLFRDFCFHQIDDNQRPWLDLGHILDCLNKLDVGSQERILLASRDGKSLVVASFQEIALCLERSFQELLQQAHGGGLV